MNKNKEMTQEEKSKLFREADKLMEDGNEEKAFEIFKTIPLAPFLAKALKDIYGGDYLKQEGYNLVEVEKEYGKEWVNK